MENRLDEAIDSINRGAFSEASEILLELVHGDRTNHQALFLLSFLLYDHNDVEAVKGFIMARTVAPQNKIYKIFENLVSVKITNPRELKSMTKDLADAVNPLLENQVLTPLPLTILTQFFMDAGKRETALKTYGKLLQRLGWDYRWTILNACCQEDDSWSWDETLYRIRVTMDEDGFTDDHIKLWLYFLAEAKSKKAQALMRMLLLQFMVRWADVRRATGQNEIPPTEFLFALSPLPERIVALFPVSSRYESMNVPLWVSHRKNEWKCKVSRPAPIWLDTCPCF